MKAAFIGTVASSLIGLKALLKSGVEVTAVLTRRRSPGNADYVDLKPFCDQNGLPCFYAEPIIKEEALYFLRQSQPEIIFCLGWSNLLSAEVLASAPMGCVGFHPAPLPRGRGRHPIIWALILGLKETASTFFLMDGGVDSGDIIHQQTVQIGLEDDATSLYDRIMEVASAQIMQLVPQLVNHSYERRPQDHAYASYWRKRSRADGHIDFRMTSESIYNLVRALRPPYLGATVKLGDREHKVWQVGRVLAAHPGDSTQEPGKVLHVQGRRVMVQCGDGAVELLEHELESLPQPGDYLI